MDGAPKVADLKISAEVLKFIGGIDEFKGAWRAIGRLAPERLSALRHVATIESIGSSTRIEDSKLTDRDVERLFSNVHIRNFGDIENVSGANRSTTKDRLAALTKGGHLTRRGAGRGPRYGLNWSPGTTHPTTMRRYYTGTSKPELQH
jgi:hypothetical protein